MDNKYLFELVEIKEEEEKFYEQRYSFYKIGGTIATGLPKWILRKEARIRDLTLEEFLNKYEVSVRCNDFDGVLIAFVEKTED